MRTAAALRAPPVMSGRQRPRRDIAGFSPSGPFAIFKGAIFHLPSRSAAAARPVCERLSASGRGSHSAFIHSAHFHFTFSSSRSLSNCLRLFFMYFSLIRAQIWTAHRGRMPSQPFQPFVPLFLARCSSSPFYWYSFRNEAAMRVILSPAFRAGPARLAGCASSTSFLFRQKDHQAESLPSILLIVTKS